MFSSKWNYILVGTSFTGTIVGVLAHNSVCFILNGFCMVWSWYLAENKRKLEEIDLIVSYELQKTAAAVKTDEEK
jgi:hypothetical protein